MECWLGGQLSVVGFCCLAGFLALGARQSSLDGLAKPQAAEKPLLAGMILGLCFYKPTLLVVLLPVLLAARQFWTLLGVALTGMGLALLTWLAVGREGIEAFANTLLGFSRSTTQSSDLVLPTWKFVDLNAFTRLLLGSSLWQRLLFLALALPPLFLLLWRAWQVPRDREDDRLTLFAIAILATPVVNLYVGIYDSIVVVLGAIVLVGRLASRGELPARVPFWLTALLSCSLGDPAAGARVASPVIFSCPARPDAGRLAHPERESPPE